MLELLKLKTEEFDEFLKNEKMESWPELNNIIEDRIHDLLNIYEMYLLSSEKHLREVNIVVKILREGFKDISDKKYNL